MKHQECFDVPQHSDSERVLPRGRCSLQPAASSSTLGSSLAESKADRAAEEEEEEEELSSRKDSLERLSCSEEEAGGLSPQRSHQDSELDEQVDDFASSVLAAISCWHYRVTMVTVRLSAASLLFIFIFPPAPPPPVLRQLRNILK